MELREDFLRITAITQYLLTRGDYVERVSLSQKRNARRTFSVRFLKVRKGLMLLPGTLCYMAPVPLGANAPDLSH